MDAEVKKETGNGKIFTWIVFVALILVVLYIAGVFDGKKENGEVIFEENVPPEGAAFVPATDGDLEKELSTPVNVLNAPNDESMKVNVFEIKAEGGTFSPAELILSKAESPFQISFAAVDADYDLFILPPIGAYVSAKNGETAVFAFDTNDGSEGVYTYVCKDKCPEGKRMEGKIIIK